MNAIQVHIYGKSVSGAVKKLTLSNEKSGEMHLFLDDGAEIYISENDLLTALDMLQGKKSYKHGHAYEQILNVRDDECLF